MTGSIVPTIMVIGATGQIGRELLRTLPSVGMVVAIPRQELDLTDAASIRSAVRSIRPTVIVNAAGYTAVDDAESDAAQCAEVNTDGPAVVADEARRQRAALVHFSTDYVFDGSKPIPYVETDAPAPLSVYGKTKLAGEQAVADGGGAYLIVRTGWVYAAHSRNFARTMLQLARDREEITVVDDQVGAPTSAPSIAAGIATILTALRAGTDLVGACEASAGVYHLTCRGETSWYQFARRILADDPRADEQVCRRVKPVGSVEFGAAARRPARSVLDNTKIVARFGDGVRMPAWEDEWTRMARPVASSIRVP
jgi:dTDP-4-dehydrorhamnose reductase